MSRAAHWDVAAYALGVLDTQESERFEEHLAGCWACAGELESMLPVVTLLSEVDGESLITAEQSRTDGRLLDRMMVEVGQHRRKVRSRQLLAAAAAVAVLATTTGVSVAAGARWFGDSGTGSEAVAEAPTSQTTPPVDRGNPGGPGIGGPELSEDGEQFEATDVQTGVVAKLVLETKTWGTQVSYQLTKLTGPRQCRLTIVREDGTKEVLNTWGVPPAGYGTKAEPQPLLLATSTATPRNEIDRIQIQEVKDGVVESLVEVPV